MINVTPIILCGGSGTRLWPLSRSGFPKQFLCLNGEESLFQQASKRMMKLGNSLIQIDPMIIVTGEEHRFIATEQLRELDIPFKAAVLEPESRNTAPALTMAALAAINTGTDPVLVVTPADQIVIDDTEYTSSLQVAINQALLGGIVTLGVIPVRAETGYGYLKINKKIINENEINKVEKFVEKPDKSTALQYLESGNYFWNSGIFVLRASVWLKSLEKFRKDIYETSLNAWKQKNEDNSKEIKFIRPGYKEFIQIPSESVDYAVMEKCTNTEFEISMVPLNAGWSDLGAWDAVWDVKKKDKNGNTYSGDVQAFNNENTLVYATSRLVTLVGLKNIIVIETPDAVLVTDKSCSQDVKYIVENLKRNQREEYATHRKVNRPWGWYDSIETGNGFKIKRIMVKPGAKISLQSHEHRAEHWVVIKGVAEVVNGNNTIELKKNQSTYIPKKTIHRLSNICQENLEIIEIQTGEKLIEEDIIRYEDDYGRK